MDIGAGNGRDKTGGPGLSDSGWRRVVGSFHSYQGAQQLVDYLSDRGFRVDQLSIEALGLRLVERVTGRRTYWQALLHGAVSGAFTGALLGFLLGLFDWFDPLVSGLWLAWWGLLLGGDIGALIGGAAHWLSGGRRAFSSLAHLEADRYDVMAEGPVAEEAARLAAPMTEERSTA